MKKYMKKPIMDEIIKQLFYPYDNLIDWAMNRGTNDYNYVNDYNCVKEGTIRATNNSQEIYINNEWHSY